MTIANDASPDRSALVYRYHERLYRLALLVVGDADAAAALLQRAYRTLPIDSLDPEIILIRALLSDRAVRRRWRWAAGEVDLNRATLGRTGAGGLLDTLAKLTPAARLAAGLHYISGSTPDEISTQLGAALAEQSPADILARLRADAARAIGLVPDDADADMLLRMDSWMDGQLGEEDALALRRLVLEQPELRALRDGIIAVRALLSRALPALFVAMPPRSLTERLLKIVRGPTRPARVSIGTRRAQGILALGVLTLAAAIIMLPALFAGRATPTAARIPTVTEMIDAAIHRFDRAPLQAGVLHEQYRIERDSRPAYLIDRWYDYAAPNRLSISLQQEGQKGSPLMQISSDGRSLVQFRNALGNRSEQHAIDAHISAEEARAILPLLRGQPLARPFSRGPADPGDLGPLYLAQARAAGASFLGQTTMLGRTAFLLTYRTEHPPDVRPHQSENAAQPAQVILAIDSQTYALLDVALIANGTAESSARHPIQAQLLEVLPDVPDERFKLPSSGDVVQRSGIASVRVPDIPDNQFMSLEDAARRTSRALLAPQQLPDTTMRGLAVAAQNGRDNQDVVLLYEGEFQNVALLPGRWYSENEQATGEERSAGDFRYRLLRDSGGDDGLSALVYRADAPEQRLLMILDDEYATSVEREATLARMIASLTPVDQQSLPALRRNFQGASVAGGQS
jgi:hypothetical protein